jgi:CO/xanthine dehydrogenase Mo-binding subunit
LNPADSKEASAAAKATDTDPSDLYYGAVVRSAIPRGVITNRDVSSLPADICTLAPDDIPGSRTMTFLEQRIPILAEREVGYEGEPLLLLAGADNDTVLRARRSVEIEYETDYTILTFENYRDTQIVAEKRIVHGDPAGALKNAFQVFEGTYFVPSESPSTAGVPSVYATVDNTHVSVLLDTQWPHHVRRSLAAVLDVPQKNISVRTMTPAFHERDDRIWYPSLLAVQAALLSMKCGKSVLLRPTKDEDTRFVRRRAPVRLAYKTGLDKEGNILVQDIRVDIDIGAYPVYGNELIERVCLSALGINRSHHHSLRGRLIHTNSPPVNVSKGLGTPAGFFAAGCHANRLAEVSHSDPLLRQKHNSGFPTDPLPIGSEKKSHKGIVSDRLHRVMDGATEVVDFRRKYAAYEMRKKRRRNFVVGDHPYRGIGFSAAYQGMGFLDTNLESHNVSMRLEDKPSLTIRVSVLPRSPATLSVWKKIAADILNIPLEDIVVEQSSAGRLDNSGPLAFGKAISTISGLIARTAAGIQKKRFRSPLPIELTRGTRAGGTTWDSRTYSGMPFSGISWAAAVVEVELHPVTLEAEILNVSCAVSCGRVYKKEAVRTELETGIYRTLQWCIYDPLMVHDSTFTEDYGFVPLFFRHPVSVQIQIIEDPGNPATGIDEVPYLVVPAALVSAISQASGLYVDRLPVTPTLLHRYLEET